VRQVGFIYKDYLVIIKLLGTTVCGVHYNEKYLHACHKTTAVSFLHTW